MSSSYSNPKFRYRPDIDGLRALAVLPVLLFHLDLGFPGGYVGVDVFFVISGFLITSIIVKEQAAGTFSMLGFWERRIRRILPALSVVVLVTIILATLFFYPSQFRPFGKEIVAQATMFSNFYFWQQDGYFAPLSEHQPLLHTWSLAVEEQFYFIFPILLTLLTKSRRAFIGVLVIFTASLIWSIATRDAYPAASFYLLPARAWELLLGSLLAISPFRWNLTPWIRQVASGAGIFLIGIPMLYYSAGTPFPGLAAMPPCLGAALIIAANSNQLSHVAPPLGSRLLALTPLVWIGTISYSLYLWHWPLIVFTKYASINEPSLIVRLSIAAASIILAWLSLRFVESPFRKKTVSGSYRTAFKSFGIITAAFIALGTIIYKADGIPSRFSDETLGYAITDNQRRNFDDTLPSILKKKQLSLLIPEKKIGEPLPILLWGDSHARSVIPLFEDLCKEYDHNIYIAHQSGTPPLLGVTSSAIPSTKTNSLVFELIKSQKIKHVILVSRWEIHAIGDRVNNSPSFLKSPQSPDSPAQQVFTESLRNTVNQLRNAGVTVWIMKQVPFQKVYPPRILANAHRYGYSESAYLKTLGTSVAEHLERQKPANSAIDSLDPQNLHIIDPLLVYTHKDGFCKMETGGKSIYYDDNHLSKHGALLLKPLFKSLFQQLTSPALNTNP